MASPPSGAKTLPSTRVGIPDWLLNVTSSSSLPCQGPMATQRAVNLKECSRIRHTVLFAAVIDYSERRQECWRREGVQGGVQGEPGPVPMSSPSPSAFTWHALGCPSTMSPRVFSGDCHIGRCCLAWTTLSDS